MKTITNIQRKSEVEKELDELLECSTTTPGFYFNIGGQEFLYDGTWEGFGILMKEGLPFKTLRTLGKETDEPLLSRRLLEKITAVDEDMVFPISSIDMTPRKVYPKYTAEKIEKLQNEYRNLVQDQGLIGN